MKVQCPHCSQIVPAANLSLDTGWGKCVACQELFPLAAVVPGFPAPETATGPPVARPFATRVTVLRTDQVLAVDVPPEGLRAGTGVVLVLVIGWLGFIALMMVGAPAGLFGAEVARDFKEGLVAVLLLLGLGGLALLALLARKIWGLASVRIDGEGLTFHQRCLGWARTRWVELERLQQARPWPPLLKIADERLRHMPLLVELVYWRGSFFVPVDSPEEMHWLAAEINDFVRTLAAKPSRTAAAEPAPDGGEFHVLRRPRDR